MKVQREMNFYERSNCIRKKGVLGIRKYGKMVLLASTMAFVILLLRTNVFAAEKVLQQKTWIRGTTAEHANDNIYYKIQVPKQGYIKVEYILDREPEWSSKICLYDSNKKKISESSVLADKNQTAYWAVRKGTYFLKSENEVEYVETEGNGTADEGLVDMLYNYNLRYSFTAVKNKGKKVTRASKAPELKRGKTAKGLVFSNEKSGIRAIYKIKVPETKKITFHFKVNTSYKSGFDSVDIRLFDAKGRLLTDGKYKKNQIYSYGTGKSKVNLKAGTYYIGIAKLYSDGSSYYSVKWK